VENSPFAILPVLALLITAMAAISTPLANADTSPDPGNHACALDHNGQLRYAAVSAECNYKSKSAAPDQPKPPVLGDIESSALRYAAGAPPVRVAPSLTVTSPAGTLAGATASVSSGLTAGQDALAFTSQNGITGSYDAATGVLTFTGTATASAYATELRSVTYRDTDAAALYGTRTISFQVSDGQPDNSLSNVESRTVQVTAKPPVAASGKAATGKNSATVTVTITGSSTAPQPPTVVAHSYKAVGNTPLGVGTHPAAPAATVTGTVLTGDSDPDPTATLTVTANTQPAHGTVTMKPNGTFTYVPNPGYSGADSFKATVAGSNAPTDTETETVTINVGTVVWYVNNSLAAPGDGEAGSPFNTLTAAVAAAGANSVVFLYQGNADAADVEGVSVIEPIEYTGDQWLGIEAVNVNDATVGATSPVAVGGGISVSGGDGNLNFGDTSVTDGMFGGVFVANRRGGTVTFGGAIAGPAVDLSDNAGATIAFTGTLTLGGFESIGDAFSATGGGTVTATGTGSTLSGPDASTVQNTLTVQNTTIGAAGLTFQSISEESGIGIDLADTGSSGGLTVTGTGTPGSGGQIGNSEGAAIQLTSTYAPGFTDMDDDGGIDGSQVNGLTLNGSAIADGNGLDFSPNSTGSPDGLTGTVSITNSTINGGAIISDTSGTLHLTAAGATFGRSYPGNIALDINADGTTDATASVTGSTFTDDPGDAFQFATDPASTGTDSVTFSNNTFRATGPGIPLGGVVITPDGNATTCAAITGNLTVHTEVDDVTVEPASLACIYQACYGLRAAYPARSGCRPRPAVCSGPINPRGTASPSR